MKYAWIAEHRIEFSITEMCRVLKVSRSGYYDSLDRPQSERAKRTLRVREAVAQVHQETDEIYGSRKITEELKHRDELETACRNTVAKAMKELGIRSKTGRKVFRPTTTQVDPSKRPAANVLDREFTATAPNQKWVTDITYLATAAGWVYLAAVVDLFSRKVVGWSVSHSLATDLVQAALKDAIEKRRPDGSKLLHHSDRGCQYTSDSYQRTLRTLGITCSMSRTGNCYDNAVAERFFWSLKYEWTNHQIYADLESTRASVFNYIEMFYNERRRHETLEYVSPNDFECQFHKRTADHRRVEKTEAAAAAV
ncbi:IS3 family transposase [Rubinisphaera italica]|uniref:Integrase core domain protein n=1 Tax=Rubinisphaera italica TaxID=2527969 RepID=A0A5C5XCQ0_9PLAN|nr:IS3 family transposase [Rubinisphaera italica]TWT60937.1 Integrase core domain protein [Rubinisphaera italica]